MEATRRAFFACFLIAAASGCSEENSPPEETVREPALPIPVAHETRYATVAIAEGKPRICGGTLGRIDRHIEAVANILDVEPEPIEIYWHERSPNSGRAAAYFDHAAIVTFHQTLLHELVHAVSIPTLGRSDKMFIEGIANAYEEGNTLLKSNEGFDVSAALGLGSRGSGHFTRWLLETYGADAFKALFDTPTPSTEEILERMESAYGMTFDELEAEFFATAPAWYPEIGTCDGLDRYAWPEDSDRFRYENVADCAAPNAFGHMGDEDEPYFMAFVLEVPPGLIGREFTAPIVLPDSTGNLGGLTPCSIGYGPPGDAEAETDIWQSAVSPFLVGEFRTTAYRVELPFLADGEPVGVEIQLRE